MKKSLLIILLFLGSLSLLVTSCDKDSDDPVVPDQLSGSYELYMNDILISEGNTAGVGMYENIVTISPPEDFAIVVSEVPGNVGDALPIDGSDRTVVISGKNIMLSDGTYEAYYSQSGTMTRVSSTKISFEGVCRDILDTATYTFRGEVESSAFSVI